MARRVWKYMVQNGPEIVFVAVVAVVAGGAGGWVGSLVPTQWFVAGVCG